MTTQKQAEAKMQAAIEFLDHELKNIRTGKANPAILDGVKVDVYGTQMRLHDIASISVPESMQLLITPYDTQNTGAIGKAIEKANLGFQPIVEGNVVRINVPPMDGTQRQKMIKACHELNEQTKVKIRQARRERNDTLRKEKQSGEISEDDLKHEEKVVQEHTDKYCDKSDALTKKKEEEVSSI